MTETISQHSDQQTNNCTKGGYWEMEEPVKKTLSTASLTGFMKHNDVKDNVENEENDETTKSETTGQKKESYWDWDDNVITKTLSSLSLSQLGVKREENEPDLAKPKPQNYWFWRNSFRSRSDMMSEDEKKEIVSSNEGREASAGGGGYWFWRNNSFSKTLSQISLEKLSTGQSTASTEGSSDGKPLTNLQHKLRNSWRKSFQHLSNNSLSRLDENDANGSKAPTWKESLNSFRDSFNNLKGAGTTNIIEETDIMPSEIRGSYSQDEDAITF